MYKWSLGIISVAQERILTDLIPFVDAPADTAQGATVRSKDQELQDEGTTSAYVVAIREH